MANHEPPFTVGVEEDYLLVDLHTGEVAEDPPAGLLRECTERSGGHISPEFLRSQIEVSTRVCRSMDELRADLARLRGIVVEVAGKYGLAPMAASTHPFARSRAQKTTDRDYFASMAHEMQAAARNLMICGMHAHVGIDDDDLRIDLQNQLSYFLPHLLALSCSSPFWEGEKTGLMSFRLTVYSSLPRTGLPERFDSYLEFRRHLDVLVRSGLIEDTTKIWWDLRPSSRYPTLETRIMDVCTSLEDTLCLAALNVSLTRMLYRLSRANQCWRRYPNVLIAENRWRAIRYSFDGKLLDLAKGEMMDFPTLLDELLELVREDAEVLACSREVAHARTILRRGTSAHRQLSVYESARQRGASDREALRAVTSFLIKETAAGATSG
jgi:carboxylate-amine ligase